MRRFRPVNSRSPYLERARLQALRPALEFRSRALDTIRRFFLDAGFIEIETPVRLGVPAMELHIDAEPSGAGYLRTSPELHMKRLLAAGYERIFQIGPCFRKGERGALHNPEYTMLEWYRANAGYMDILADTEGLLDRVVRAGGNNLRRDLDFTTPWPRVAVRTAYLDWAGWDPVANYDEDRFNADMAVRIEPRLPKDRPFILIDYPAAAAALARRKPGNEAVAERWELYIGGIEVANAFGELTDPAEQRQRFADWAAARRAAGRPVYPLDEAFLGALETGLPPSGGIALGIDRLVLALTGAASLDDAMPFRENTR